VARFYTDEDIPLALGPLLAAGGHDVVTTRALGRAGVHDGDQLLFAARDGRALITHNEADYVLLHQAWQLWAGAWRNWPPTAPGAPMAAAPGHGGILVLPQAHSLARAVRLERWRQAIEELVASGRPLDNELYAWRLARWDRYPWP
jgi:hypothetical protein